MFAGKYKTLFAAALVIVAASVFFLVFSRCAGQTETSEKGDGNGVSDNNNLSIVISDVLAEKLAAEEVSVEIERDGAVTIGATVRPERILQLFDSGEEKLPSAARIFLKLLPERTQAEGVFRFFIDRENRRVLAEIEKISVNGTELDKELVPSFAEAALEDAVNLYLLRAGVDVNHIKFQDGQLMISG